MFLAAGKDNHHIPAIGINNVLILSVTMKMKKEKQKKNLPGQEDWIWPEPSPIKTDSLLRETTSHYIRLIGDADRKARIMIVVNSILLTIGVTILTRVMHNQPLVWISAVLLIAANIITLFFSVASVKPELHSPIEKETEENILHYKKCIEYSLVEYTSRIKATMNDDNKKEEAMIRDLYFFGNLLGTKYKLILRAYLFFYWGIVFSITSYLIILLVTHFTDPA